MSCTGVELSASERGGEEPNYSPICCFIELNVEFYQVNPVGFDENGKA